MAEQSPLGRLVPPMAAGKRATIYDIARVTGLSPSTVSRGLSKPGRLNAETELRIKETADLLGYQANPIARALPTGRTGNIGMVVPTLDHPVFSGVVRGVERSSASAGFTVMVSETGDVAELGEEGAERLLPLVDGLILVSPRQDDRGLRRIADRKPLVLVNRMIPGIESVVPDPSTGYAQAVDEVVRKGHRRIAFLPIEGSWTSQQRAAAVEAEAVGHGLEFVLTSPGSPLMEGGAENLGLARATGATAVFTYNDLMAVGILHACHAAGQRVPGELSVVGYDDIFGADFVIPTLSSIRPPLADMGRAAVRVLVRQMNGETNDVTEALPTRFIPRGSTGSVGTSAST